MYWGRVWTYILLQAKGTASGKQGRFSKRPLGPGIVAYVSKRDEEHLNGQLSGRGKTDTKHVVNGSEGE